MSKPAIISRKQTKFETKLEVEKNIQNANVSFNVVTLAIYSNNNGNMVVGEITEFFFPTARCRRTIYVFIYKGINIVL